MVFRIHKTNNFTVMSTEHLRDRSLSLKAKGLLSVMLSLPDDWNYSINGLVAISGDTNTAVENALHELKEIGYLVVTKKNPNETDSGRYEYIYDVYESPKQYPEKQGVEKQGVEKQGVEKQGVVFGGLNIIENNELLKKQNTNKQSIKHKYGEYAHVLLTDDELSKLNTEYGTEETQEAIKYLDEYIEMKGAKYKSHYLALKKWVYTAVKEKSKRNTAVADDGLTETQRAWLKQYEDKL